MVLMSISTQFWKLAFTQNPAHKCLIGPLSDSPIWTMFFNKWKVQRTFDPSIPWSAIQHLAASQENWMTPRTMTTSKTRPLPKDSIRFHSGSDRIIELDNKLVISRVWYRGEVKGSYEGLCHVPGTSSHCKCPGLLLPRPLISRHWGYRYEALCSAFSCMFWGFKFRSSLLQARPFTKCVISLGLYLDSLQLHVSLQLSKNKSFHWKQMSSWFFWTGSGISLGQEGSQVWHITTKKSAKSYLLRLAGTPCQSTTHTDSQA